MELFHASPWVPAEWIKAHGIEPRGLWYADDLNLGPTRSSAGTCAFAQAVVRFAETHPEKAVLLTTHCDQLRRGFDTLAGSLPSRAFLFNLPATWQTSVAERLYDCELERLSRFLLALGGQLPTPEALRQTIDAYARARKTLLAQAEVCLARAYAEAIARFHWDGPSESVDLSITASPSGAATARDSAIPIALLGGPLPRVQWPLIDVIERAGARVALNGTEAGERSLWTVSPSEVQVPPDAAALSAMRLWLARSYLRNGVDVFQRPNDRLYVWLKARLTARAIRGIVLWHYVGCDLWRAEAQSLREAFGLPLLLLDAGDAPSASARDNGRVEAFVESLR
jgi:benzoyl-CoA reductase/2-hydroxyglutaryl-CoA dehydratase subunit BcrC/BadD/HgdB